ncbi:sulfatase-like hydrolase/transferase [Pasteurellaceae bacterium HPA106]|uniref:sulfatase-like hydrolase/transferase n=1 Tax=Spirabiliibacterium pneumoniae TaxID=221400 RepID=UPI001AACEA30|nr:sulfatase-like hydrolase/transferase [Spirabiliibacterium pneumoniae]MBE2895314.1 sulfatase-like hydrolase/transferase [Spirabiliibacterium pneumoniae]
MSISRRTFIKGVAGSSVAATLAGKAVANDTPNKKENAPKLNLLLVFPDEMRAQAQGFKGEDPAITPHLDAFAKEAKVMDQMASNYPLCSPFRGMLMTGQYPLHNGVTGNTHDYGGKVGIELSPYARCWSDVLKDEGYALGYIGKWHLDVPHEPYIKSYNNPMEGRYWNEWTPPDRRHGFDFWYSYGTYDLHMKPMYWGNDTPREYPEYVDQWGPEHEADMAINYLRNEGNKYRDPNKPFALVVSMNPPHSPYNQVPQKYLDMYKDKTSKDLNTRPNVDWDKKYMDGYGPDNFKSYMAMVTGVDEQFGRILAELDKQGLSDNTLVVFFSDHGCCIGSHGKPTKNVVYEESMRVPMMFRLPGKIKPGVNQTLMSAPDIYPTVLDLLGLKDSIPGSVEGVSLAEQVLHDKGESPTSQLYLFVPYGQPSFGRRGVRTATHTLEIDRQDGEPLKYTLFDNVNDPYQEKNIADQNPELIEKLVKEELIPWLEKTGDSWRPVEFITGPTKKMQKKLDTCATPEQPKA